MDHLPHVDVQLVAAAQAGDLPARVALLRPWVPVVLRWCRGLGGPWVDPDDPAQEVLLVAHQRLHTLKDPTRLAAWLYGITRKVLGRHRWRGRMHALLHGPLSPKAPSGDDPARRLELSEVSRSVRDALSRLPREQQEVLFLVDALEYSVPEVADWMGINLNTAYSRLRLARERFRTEARRSGLDPDADLPTSRSPPRRQPVSDVMDEHGAIVAVARSAP